MKKILLSAFTTIACLANSQNLTMTKAAFEPAAGDIKSTVSLDTSFYTTGLPTNITGTNVTWDFSNLAINSTVGVISSSFIAAASATVPPPTGATLAEDQGGSYTFYKSVTTPTTEFQLQSIKFGTVALTFTNTALIARWPVSYGYDVIDNISGTAQQGTVNAQFTGSVHTVADGSGTLKLPLGNNFMNVLRLKSVQTITVTIFTIIQIATVKQTIYQYFKAGDKFPVLTVNASSTTFSSQTTDATTANGNAAYLPIGIKENSLKPVNFNVLPNPANTEVSVQLENNKIASSLVLINSIGQTLKSISNTNTMNVSEIPSGVYYLEVHSGDHSARKPVMITH
jgi:hypothetical protein